MDQRYFDFENHIAKKAEGNSVRHSEASVIQRRRAEGLFVLNYWAAKYNEEGIFIFRGI